MNQYENTDIGDLIIACREHNDSAFDELVKRYTPMMRKVISGFSSPALEFSELFSEACVALHSAMLRYDLEQGGVTFGLFARICVQHRIVDLLRSEAGKGVEPCDVDVVADGESIERGLVERETFEFLMRSARSLLSEYEYRVLVLHIQGYKTSAIAKMLDRSAKSVDNAKYRIFSRLRLLLGDVSEI